MMSWTTSEIYSYVILEVSYLFVKFLLAFDREVTFELMYVIHTSQVQLCLYDNNLSVYWIVLAL